MNNVSKQRECSTLEFKRELTNTFLKTVSAYANYGTGQIIFGVSDDGTVEGLSNPEEVALQIENKIITTIDPSPPFNLEIKPNSTIILTVEEGAYKPYVYHGRAYMRRDSATMEVDRLEHGRLVLQGTNVSYETLPANNQALTFKYLEQQLIAALDIAELDQNILKTLELQNSSGTFNKAAELLSDQHDLPGIDVAKFGQDINEIRERESFHGASIIEQLQQVTEFFKRWYTVEKIQGTQRTIEELVPSNAFREALANALVHRTWDVPAPVKVSMFNDRIEVASPGGLPPGITPDEYSSGQFSLLRNPILAGVFFRLRLIEKFGTGILRIKYAYQDQTVQPTFVTRAGSITVTLPVVTAQPALNEQQTKVVQALSNGSPQSRAQLQDATKLNRDTLIRVLNELIELHAVEKLGAGRATRYQLLRGFSAIIRE